MGVGKTGAGAGSAMAQIARDRLIAAARAALHTAEEQVKALWLLRVPEDKGDSLQYLLALLIKRDDTHL